MKRGVAVAVGLALFLLFSYTCTLLLGIKYLEADIEQDSGLPERIRGLHTQEKALRISISTKDARYYCFTASPQPNIGRPQCGSTHQKPSSILVIGALHFVGSRLVSHLASLGRDVRALAGYESVLSEDKELVWYREHQLRTHHGVSVHFANLSSTTQVEAVLRGPPLPTDIVFVPSGVDGELLYSELEDSAVNDAMERSLEEFVTVLERLRMVSPCSRVVLISLSNSTLSSTAHADQLGTIQAWMVTFELLASVYRNSYHMPVSVFRLNTVHGPWGREALYLHQQQQQQQQQSADLRAVAIGHCWFIKDVVAALELQMLEEPNGCQVLELNGCSLINSQELDSVRPRLLSAQISNLGLSLKWAASYVSDAYMRRARDADVIFTSYFTSIEDFQRQHRHSPDRFQYMAEFYSSIKRHGLRAVIFHDGLDSGFQHRLSSDYPGVSFSRVQSLHNRSTNDARFYAYYQYLREHPEIDKVLLTDVSDVVIQHDPFQLMSLLGDWLYVGTDIDIFPNMQTMPWIKERLRACFGNYSTDTGDLSKLMRMDTVYNAGSIGGSRETVLNLLATMVAYLNTAPESLNCNMPSLNYAVHQHFFERVFTGFPLSSRFLRYQNAPKAVYIIHK